MESPKNLFQSCLDFICDNLHSLESLIGFPDSIGRQILFAAFHIDSKSNYNEPLPVLPNLGTDYISKSLQVFFEAYGDCGILDSLSLQKDPFFLSETIDDCWWVYKYVSHLDLSYCGLGDSHDILPQLLGSTYRLRTLILKENSLSDEGIRKLTLRCRMFKQEGLSLETLNLSDNARITVKSLHFLSCLGKLAIIDASNTKISGKDIQGWSVLPQDYESETGCDCIRNSLTVESSGWGAQAVEIWRRQLIQARHQKTIKRQCPRARLGTALESTWNPPFYNRIGKKEVIGKDKSCHPKSLKTNERILLISRKLFHCPHCSVHDVKPFPNGSERNLLPSVHCAGRSALSGPHGLKHKLTGGIATGNNQCENGKTKKFYFAKGIGSADSLKITEKSSEFLPYVDDLDTQKVTKENLKCLHRGTDNTYLDNSQLLNVMAQSNNSIVSEYQASPSSNAKRSKRSLLEVLDEYT